MKKIAFIAALIVICAPSFADGDDTYTVRFEGRAGLGIGSNRYASVREIGFKDGTVCILAMNADKETAPALSCDFKNRR